MKLEPTPIFVVDLCLYDVADAIAFQVLCEREILIEFKISKHILY